MFGKKKENPQSQEESKKNYEDNIRSKSNLSQNKEDSSALSQSNNATEIHNQNTYKIDDIGIYKHNKILKIIKT